MNTTATLDICGLEELSPTMAAEIEGGTTSIWDYFPSAVVGVVAQAGQLVKGVVDGWNAYEK